MRIEWDGYKGEVIKIDGDQIYMILDDGRTKVLEDDKFLVFKPSIL